MRYLGLFFIFLPIQSYSANIIGEISCSTQIRYAYINLIFKGSKETLDNMETYEEEQERLRRERGDC